MSANKKSQLYDFVQKVQRTPENELLSNTDLQMEYKSLYEEFEHLKSKDIDELFPNPTDVRVVSFLKLGRKFNKPFEKLAAVIASSADMPAAAIAEFLKSPAGYYDTNAPFEHMDDQEVQQLFGGIFGVQLAQECVQSFRAEKFGSIIGYATSGLAKDDIQLWHDTPASQREPTLAQHLLKRIAISDVSLVYKCEDGRDGNFVSCYIDESEHRQGMADRGQDVRGSGRADHCFVNKETKTIVLGGTTSASDTTKQGTSAVDALRALQEMVQQPQINGRDNPYHTYKVVPFYYMNGRICATETNAPTKGRGKQFLKRIQQVETEQKNINILGQMLFLGMAGNCKRFEHVQGLLSHNPIISGTDTLDLYYFGQELDKMDKGVAKEKCLALLSTKIQESLELLTKVDMDFSSESKHTGQGAWMDFVGDICRTLEKLPSVFGPLEASTHERYIGGIVQRLEAFNTKHTQTVTHLSDLQDRLIDLPDDLAFETFNKKASRKMDASLNLPQQWKDPTPKSFPQLPKKSFTQESLPQVGRIFQSIADEMAHRVKEDDREKFVKTMGLYSKALQIAIDTKDQQQALKTLFPRASASDYQPSITRMINYIHSVSMAHGRQSHYPTNLAALVAKTRFVLTNKDFKDTSFDVTKAKPKQLLEFLSNTSCGLFQKAVIECANNPENSIDTSAAVQPETIRQGKKRSRKS